MPFPPLRPPFRRASADRPILSRGRALAEYTENCRKADGAPCLNPLGARRACPPEWTLTMVDLATRAAPEAGAASPPDHIADAIRRIGPRFDPAVRSEFIRLYADLLRGRPQPATRIARDVAYGPDARHLMDLHVPLHSPAKSLPVLAYFHGGGYVEGHKNLAGDLIYGCLAEYFVQSGLIVANVTYRLAPQAPWPEGARDVGRAARWLGDHVAEFGGDPRRLVLMGHSAGGTHVAACALHAGLRDAKRPPVAGLVLVSGTYDIEDTEQPPNIAAYYGTDRSSYARKSTIRNLATGPYPPMLIATAEFDPQRFRDHADALARRLAELGAAPERLWILGHNHVSEIYHVGTSDESLGPHVAAFCKKVAGG
jgi:triacylglycerol lipase